MLCVVIVIVDVVCCGFPFLSSLFCFFLSILVVLCACEFSCDREWERVDVFHLCQ